MIIKNFYPFNLFLINLLWIGMIPQGAVLAQNRPESPSFAPFSPQSNQFTPVPQGYEPPPFGEGSSGALNEYRLDSGDSISVSVFRFPEFNFGGVIDENGDVIVPILGRLAVKGLTVREVENKISFELNRRFLREAPQVTAVLSGQRPVNLTIIGEVTRPGYYNIASATPISAILTQAGGTTDKADLRSIIIKRRLPDNTVVEEKVNLYAPLIEGSSEPRVRLQPGDTIIVSQLEVGQDQDYDRFFIARSNVPRPVITVKVVAPTGVAGASLRNINVPNGSTFLDAVALLPEFIPLVTNNQVTLMRFDPELGKVVTQSLNVRQTIQGGDATQNVPLRQDDVIVVSRTLLGRILGGIRVITQPIRDIFGFTDFIQRTIDGRIFNRGGDNFRF